MVLNGPEHLPKSGQVKRLVILLHGYGSNGQDLIGLVPSLEPHLPDTAFLSPNAPEACPGSPSGFQWFPLTNLAREEREIGTKKAAPILQQYIDEALERFNLSADKVALVGFSQGTMMSLHVGLRREQQLAGILAYSGALSSPQDLAAEIKSRPRVFLVHGDRDPVVPPFSLFEACGAFEVVHVPYDRHISPNTQHFIANDGMHKGVDFLKSVLLQEK